MNVSRETFRELKNSLTSFKIMINNDTLTNIRLEQCFNNDLFDEKENMIIIVDDMKQG